MCAGLPFSSPFQLNLNMYYLGTNTKCGVYELHVWTCSELTVKLKKKTKEARRKNDFKHVSNLSYIKNQLYLGQRLVFSFSYATRNAYCQQQFGTEREMYPGNGTTMNGQATMPQNKKGRAISVDASNRMCPTALFFFSVVRMKKIFFAESEMALKLILTQSVSLLLALVLMSTLFHSFENHRLFGCHAHFFSISLLSYFVIYHCFGFPLRVNYSKNW